MATANRFEAFSQHLAEGVHNFAAAGHVVKMYLSNAAPSASLDAVKADLAEIAGGNGYTAGGHDTQNDTSRTGAVTSVTGIDIVITAAGGTVGPFEHSPVYNDTPTSPADPLCFWWTYPGGAITLQIGETYTFDIGTSMWTIG